MILVAHYPNSFLDVTWIALSRFFTWGGEFLLGPLDFTGGAQVFAQLGFAVIIMDGRGTPYRSKSFHDYSNGNLERAAGLEDHVVALKQLAQRYPFLDKKVRFNV